MRVRTVALWLCLAATTLSAFAGDVLRYETATTIKVGPLTGTQVIEETGPESFTVDATILLSKNGGKLEEVDASLTLDSHNLYDLALSAEMTDTYGRLNVVIINGNKVIKESFGIINALTWDEQYTPVRVRAAADANVIQWNGVAVTGIVDTGVAYPSVTTVKWSGDNNVGWDAGTSLPQVTTDALGGNVAALQNLESAFDGTGYGFPNCTIPTVTYVNNIPSVNIANGAITTATFGAGAIDAASIATGAIGALELAAGAVDEIVVDVATELDTHGAGNWETATGFGDATEAKQDAIITDLDDIKGTGFVKDTHSLIDIETYVDLIDDGTSGLAKIATDVAAVLVDTDATIPGTITTVDSEVGQILAVTDGLHNFDPDIDDVATVTTVDAIAGTIGTFDALDTALDSAHGAGSWATATGFSAADVWTYSAGGGRTLSTPADYKATGFSTHAAADVWTAGTRALTDKDDFTISGTIDTLDGLHNFDPAIDDVAVVTTTENVTGLAANVITAASIATAAIDADAIAADAIGSSEINTYMAGRTLAAADYFVFGSDTVTYVQNVASASISSLGANVITAASMNADASAEIRTEMDSNSADFNTLITGVNLTKINSTSLDADFDENINFFFGPAATTSKTVNDVGTAAGTMDANLIQINGTSIAGTGSQVADSWLAFWNVATPTFANDTALADFKADVTDMATNSHVDDRTLAAADYFLFGSDDVDTVTTCTTTTTNTDLVSAANIKTAMEADGSKLDHLWEMTEDDGGTRRYTTNALEQAPDSDTTTNLTLHSDYDAAKTAAQAGDLMLADLTKIHGSALSETSSGYLAASFEHFFDQATRQYNINTPLSSFKADVTDMSTQTYVATRTLAKADYFLFGSDDVATVTTTDTATDVTNGVTLAADAITSAKIADDAFSAEHFNTGAFTADAFAADALAAATFATGSFTAEAFAADALVAATFNTGAFTADVFAADAIVAATFATNAFAADGLATDAVNEIRDGILDDATRFSGADIANLDAAISTVATPAQVATALTDINLDHLAGTAGGIPSVPAGTWIDTIIDDTDELQTDDVPGLIAALHNFDPDIDDVATVTTVDAISGTIGTFDALLPQLDTEHGDGPWTTGGGDSATLLLNTTVDGAPASQTQFVLAAGSDDDSAYESLTIVLYDADNNNYPSVRTVTMYVGGSQTAVIDAAPDFTLADGDGVKIFVAERTLDQASAIDGKTMRQVLRYLGAVIAGETSGAGTGTEMFKGLDGLTDRVQVIIDVNGDRATINYDP